MARDEGGNLHIIGKLTSADEEVRITKRRYSEFEIVELSDLMEKH